MISIRPPRRGVIVFSEQNTLSKEPAETLLYIVPGTVCAMTARQVLEAPPKLGATIMEAWFRANFRPASNGAEFQNPIQQPWNTPMEWLTFAFNDPRTGGPNQVHQAVVKKLTDETPVWVPRASNQPDLLRQEATRALNVFETEIRRRVPTQGAIGHNNPPEPLDAQALDPEQYRRALELIERIRGQLTAARPNPGAVAESAQQTLSLVSQVASWFAKKGDVVATEFAKAFGKAGGVAAGAVAVAAVASMAKPSLFSSLGSAALRLVHALQALAGS
jgi:hypothetical protein